jgi:hypothetical protein
MKHQNLMGRMRGWNLSMAKCMKAPSNTVNELVAGAMCGTMDKFMLVNGRTIQEMGEGRISGLTEGRPVDLGKMGI